MGKKIDQEKCNHKKRQVLVVGGQNKIIKCNTCEKRWEVPFNAEEKRLWLERTKKEDQRLKDIHALGWAFHKAFYRYKKVRMPLREARLYKSEYQLSHDGWKYSGYKMMKQIEKFAKKHPDVILLSCDDSYNAGSMIVLIPHRSKEEYWGTTVVSIPQCTGEPPLEMFLYPGHAMEIERALHIVNQESRQKQKTTKKKDYWPKP
jgi:hypothetical protein